jgi:hypothetical protein
MMKSLHYLILYKLVNRPRTYRGAKHQKHDNNMKGIKTEFFTDVKMPIVAGMEFGTKNYKMKTVGYEIYRQYFDSEDKDLQVGVEIIERKIK